MKTCLVVADASRARFLILESAETSKLQFGPNLVELKDFINPEADEYGRDLWSDTKTGVTRDSSRGQAHSYDDHREEHEAEFVRRFVKTIAEETKTFVRAQKANTLIIAAPKKMLGFLRSALNQNLKGNVSVKEVPKDFSKLKPVELHEHLAKQKILPPRRRPPAPGSLAKRGQTPSSRR
jgi:protein required for attachment to host cells